MNGIKPCLLFLCFCLFIQYFNAEIVINEVCYDPMGSDEGWEWIELFNNGSSNEQLDGAKILSGGSSFTLQYTLPLFELRPHRYLLIGSSSIISAQLFCNFSFQNGGSETDGIRYVSPDGTYTDTILYDSPNTNLLLDDYNNPGNYFAPDVLAGYSLARIYDGYDTNNCEADFIAEANPTPGLANHLYCDYTFGTFNLIYENGSAELDLWLKNLSEISPTISAELTVTQNNNLLAQQIISPIPALDSLLLSLTFFCNSNPLTLKIGIEDDPDSTNNLLTIPVVTDLQPDIYINEFLANPETANQEWIEIYCGCSQKGIYYIEDSSAAKIRFTLPETIGYYVICRNTEDLLIRYPDCPPASIILAENWTYLNNSGDILVLKNESATLDSLVYTGEEILKGISREKVIVDSTFYWQNCFSETGGTPGLTNSTIPSSELPDLGKVTLSGSPCNAKAGDKITLAYNLLAASNHISCKVFDLSGRKICTIADYALVNNSGFVYWNGCQDNGTYAPRGLYIILWEAQNADGGKIMRKQFTAVLKG